MAMSPAASASFIAETKAIFAALAVPRDTPPAELPFIRQNHDAMEKMVACMAVDPTGNVDNDFVAMMAPHHQEAIDMAQAELRYGRNEQLLRTAQEIIVGQLLISTGMGPRSRTGSGSCFDRGEGVLLLELRRAQIAER